MKQVIGVAKSEGVETPTFSTNKTLEKEISSTATNYNLSIFPATFEIMVNEQAFLGISRIKILLSSRLTDYMKTMSMMMDALPDTMKNEGGRRYVPPAIAVGALMCFYIFQDLTVFNFHGRMFFRWRRLAKHINCRKHWLQPRVQV